MNDNFKCIYKILKALELGMDFEKINPDEISYERLEITKNRWIKYLQMMSDAGYISGVVFRNYTDGEVCVSIENIQITLKGLEYLSENTIMQRCYKTAKGIKDVIPNL